MQKLVEYFVTLDAVSCNKRFLLISVELLNLAALVLLIENMMPLSLCRNALETVGIEPGISP